MARCYVCSLPLEWPDNCTCPLCGRPHHGGCLEPCSACHETVGPACCLRLTETDTLVCAPCMAVQS